MRSAGPASCSSKRPLARCCGRSNHVWPARPCKRIQPKHNHNYTEKPMNAPEQVTLDGIPEQEQASHMIARVSAVAIKLAFPFAATQDIRFYLNGVNIRPLADGSVMIVATNGHRYIVVRDPHGL